MGINSVIAPAETPLGVVPPACARLAETAPWSAGSASATAAAASETRPARMARLDGRPFLHRFLLGFLVGDMQFLGDGAERHLLVHQQHGVAPV